MVPLNSIVNFFKKHWDRKSPLLLAFSGGTDSLALLHIILQMKERFPLALAHVDHGWRKESAQEAQKLEKMAQSLGLPFHLKTLDSTELKGNLEAACRQERLNFFGELCLKYNYQAVILGHHADDQAETVLKKVLEGSSFLYLSGLKPIVEIQGIQLWRPMLGWTKNDMIKWNQNQGLVAIDDSTNRDPKFLRGKFRTTIIPNLSKAFGKEVSQSLCRLGNEAAEFRDYMNLRISPYIDQVFENDFGMLLDLSSHISEMQLFEIKYCIRYFCEKANFSLPLEIFEKVVDLLINGLSDKEFYVHGKKIFVDRQCVFIVTKDYPEVQDHQLELELGSFVYGPWNVNVAFCDESHNPCSGWKDLWKDGGRVILPFEGKYILRMPVLNAGYPGRTSIRKWWTNNKVPAFLRLKVPIIYGDNGKVCHEFLSGRMKIKEPKQGSSIKVTLYCR